LREPSLVEEPPPDEWNSPAAPESAATLEKAAAIDLVARAPKAREHLEVEERSHPSEPADLAEPRVRAARAPRRRGRRRWLGFLVLLVSLALLGGGAYQYRNRIPRQQLRWFVASTIAKGHTLLSRLHIR
jgi:hypothetical protein